MVTPSPWPPLNCRALSLNWFSAHHCFTLFFAASDMCFHISGRTLSGREVVCFLVILSPDHVYPSGGWSQISISFKVSKNFSHMGSHHHMVRRHFIQQRKYCDLQHVFPTTSSDVCVVLVASMYLSGMGNDSSLGE